jgi:hypothetical protein
MRDARPLKVKAGMVSRTDGNSPSSGEAALLPRAFRHVLLFSAKALLEYRHLRQ